MRKTIFRDYLQLREIGLLEIIIALYPILANYRFGMVPFNLFILILLDAIVLFRRRKHRVFHKKEFIIFTVFVLLHEVIWLFVINNPPRYFVSSIIAFSILLLSVIILAPAVNWNKFVGSLNWVTIICLVGIVVQFIQVARGQLVGQIPLPFLESGASRLDDFYDRPHSFFPEPAAYASFMLLPLFISFYQRKVIWAFIIAFGILASSSTTGLVLLFCMLIVSIFLGKANIITKISFGLVGVLLLAVLVNTSIFDASMEKLTFERENVEESSRLAQGVEIVSNMAFGHYFLGVPYANAYDFLRSENALGSIAVWGTGDDASVYISTFWNILLRFGVIGVFLYFLIYIKAALRDRELWPLIACFLLTMFSSSTYISAMFVFQFICIYAFENRDNSGTR